MAAESSGVTCPRCGTLNRAGARFCMHCGNALAAGCPTCGTVNPPGARFCTNCGTALQPGLVTGPAGVAEARAAYGAGSEYLARSGVDRGAVGTQDSRSEATTAQREATRTEDAEPPAPGDSTVAPVAERRLVSVLFVDLVGFTPFAEGRDAEEVRELLSRYFELATDVVGRYGGTIDKFIGDAVMAVWGAPVAREDDAERAVRAGLDLVDLVTTLGPEILARAGVLTGEAAVTIGGANQGLIAGDLVNTASRLQSAAEPGTVLVGEATQRAASAAIAFEPAGAQALKGKRAPVPAWRAVRVVAERRGRNRSEALEAPFVGRDEELRLLKDLFHASAREGKSRLVSLMGPAGIGKTRLSWELKKYLDGLVEEIWWHAGRSPAYGEGITFWALGEMVRRRAGLVETDDEATTRERVAAIVREHVSGDEEARWIEAALLTLLGVGEGAPIDSDELFAAWRTFFEHLAAKLPVVMVFEETHHADDGLLDFIDHLMEWSRSSPIMVVTLARPELLERRPTWGARQRAFTSIHLEPLLPVEMEHLLGGLVPGLAAPMVERIVARADGVPLYAVETVRMLLAQGRLIKEGDFFRPMGDLDDLAVPETLTALISARLDSLDPIDRALVEDAAVLGKSFTVAGLAAVSGQPIEALEPRLRTLVRRELLALDVDPRSPGRGHYAFVQALVREVAYNTLSRKDRKARHLAAARHFETLGTDELAGGLAGHYHAAQQLAADDAEARALAAQARIALRSAADRATELRSYAQARLFLEQALEVTTDPAERADLHERAYRESLNVLDPQSVLRHASAAEQERRKTGDRQAIAIAAALHAHSLSTASNDPKAALEMIEALWEEFSDLEPTQAGVELMLEFMRAHRALADTDEALAWIDRLLPVAERLGDVQAIARALHGRGVSLIVSGRPHEGLMLLRGSHQLALDHDLTEVELSTRVQLTFYEQWGDPAAGLELGREGLEIGRHRGSRAYSFAMVGNSAICAMRVGEWDWVEALLEEWLDVAADENLRKEFRVDRALLSAQRGRDPSEDIEAASGAISGVTDPQYDAYEHLARAAASLAAGELEAAIEHADRSASSIEAFSPLAIPIGARAALWAGDAPAATRLIERAGLAAFAGRALDADRLRIGAGIAALEGRRAEALEGFLDALRSYDQLGLRFDEAAGAVDLAVVLPGIEGESSAAAEAIASARDTLGALGARPYLDRLDSAASATSVARYARAIPSRVRDRA